MLNRISALCAAVALVVLVGCGGGGGDKKGSGGGGGGDKKPATTTTDKKGNAGGAAAPYSADKGTASIKGIAKWEGDAPKRPQVDTSGDAKCHAMHKDSALTKEEVVVNDGKLANVIVYVKSGAEKWTYDTPTTAVTLDQKGCQYHPHVISIMAEQPLVIRNSDDLAHNVHALGTNEFNISQSKQGQEDKKKMNEPDFTPIKCDIHKWMQAYAGVFSHPFHAVTNDKGEYEIKGLPPGDYEIAVWHESAKEDGKVSAPDAVKVTVGDKEARTQDFSFKAK